MLLNFHRPRRSERPGYLCVVASSNQLYSGTGTALFEWILYAKDFFRFGLLMDNVVARNVEVAREFCVKNGVEFISEGAARKSGAPDPGAARIAYYLRSGKWPYVEIVSWANAATNIDVVTAAPEDMTLIYTPHTQPLWTLAENERYFLVEPVFRAVLVRSTVVLCDSPAEAASLREQVASVRAIHVPIGVDERKFALSDPGTKIPQVLLVCDFMEHRKRVDLAFSAIQRAMKKHDIDFAVAGRGSEAASLPSSIEPRTKRMGYVDERTLVSLYQQSSVFLLLSDYEAFGIPIVEALFCGTRVVINDQAEMRSLFKGLPGVYLVNNRNAAAIDTAIATALEDHTQPAEIRGAAVAEFGLKNAYGRKLDTILKNSVHQRGLASSICYEVIHS
jgi:glycosyltransferase involved in cell wall biosynthesis